MSEKLCVRNGSELEVLFVLSGVIIHDIVFKNLLYGFILLNIFKGKTLLLYFNNLTFYPFLLNICLVFQKKKNS